MATFVDNMTAARNSLAAEFAGEAARRAALVAAGNPAPTSYSVSGKSMSWNEYVSTMNAQIKELNETIVAMGGDGGLYETIIEGYSG